MFPICSVCKPEWPTPAIPPTLIRLDGVDLNDQANGYAFTAVLPVTLDSVQEFRVTTTLWRAVGQCRCL